MPDRKIGFINENNRINTSYFSIIEILISCNVYHSRLMFFHSTRTQEIKEEIFLNETTDIVSWRVIFSKLQKIDLNKTVFWTK